MFKINRIHVMKFSGFLTFFGVLLGLFLGIIISLVSALQVDLSDPYARNLASAGVLSAIIFPFIFGVLGFFSGIIFTPLANWVLKVVKGINFDGEVI